MLWPIRIASAPLVLAPIEVLAHGGELVVLLRQSVTALLLPEVPWLHLDIPPPDALPIALGLGLDTR